MGHGQRRGGRDRSITKAAADLTVERLEVRRLMSTVTWAGGSGNWNDPSKWSGGAVPTYQDDAVVPGGSTVTVTDSQGPNTVTSASGSTIDVAATGGLTGRAGGRVAGTLTVEGNLEGSDPTTPLVLAGTTTVTGAIGGGTVRNDGTLSITGNTVGYSRQSIVNNGTMRISADVNFVQGTVTNNAGHTIQLTSDATVSQFILYNSGTLAKTGGTGTSTLTNGGAIRDYGGTIDVETGQLTIAAGSYFQGTTFKAVGPAGAINLDNSVGTGTGNFTFSGTVTGTGPGNGHLNFVTGTTYPGLPDTGGDPATTTFKLNFPAGFANVQAGMNFRQAGGHQLVNAGTLQFTGDAQHAAVDLDNTGTIAVTGTGSLGNIAQTGFLNDTTGVIDFRGDGGFATYATGQGGSNTVTNRGLIEKTGGTGTSVLGDIALDSEGGRFAVTSGTLAVTGSTTLAGGTGITVAAGATFAFDTADPALGYTGSITTAGAITGTGAGTVLFESGAFYGQHQNDGTGPDVTTLNFPAGMAQVTAGTFDVYGNDAPIVNAGELDYVGDVDHLGTTLDNTGTIKVTGQGNLADGGGGTFTNDTTGVINFTTDAGLVQGGRDGLNNKGKITKTGGTGTTDLGANNSNVIFSNSVGGTFDVESGTLQVSNGNNDFTFAVGDNAITAAAGTTFDLGGADAAGDRIFVQGNLSLAGAGSFTFSGGYLYGPSTDRGQDATNPATLNFAGNQFTVTGGGFADNTTLINVGDVNFATGDLGALDNKGTVTLGDGAIVSSADFYNDVGGVLLTAASPGVFFGGNNGRIDNHGVVAITPGAGNTFDLSETEMSNSGTVIFGAGTTLLPWVTNQYVQYPELFPDYRSVPAGSTFQLNAGATVNVATAPTLTAVAGTVLLNAGSSFPALAGVATVTGHLSVLSGETFATAGDLTNNGTLSVGGSLTVNGNYAQAPSDATATPPVPTLDFLVAADAGSAAAPAFHVTGTTALAGNLTADYVNGYAGPGGAYTVATFTSASSGAFASTAGTAPFFTPSVSPTQIVLNGTAFSGSGGSDAGNIPIPVGGIVTPTPTPTPTPTDLAITSVTAPASFTAGSTQTLTWAVTNAGTGPTTANWQDSVFLSADGTISADDVLLARVPQTTAVAAGGTYTGSVMVAMPALTPGVAYKVLVYVDSRGTLNETSYANNLAASAGSTETVPQLALGQTTAGTISAGQSLLYALPVTAGQDVNLAATFAAALTADLFVSFNAIPTPAAADQSAADPNQTAAALVFHVSRPGTLYVLVDARPSAAAGSAFTLTPSLPPVGPLSISPSQTGNGTATFATIRGVGFTPGTTAALVMGSTTIAASSVTYVDGNTLYATFPTFNQPPTGTYDVQTTTAGVTSTLPGAFTIHAQAVVSFGGGGGGSTTVGSPGSTGVLSSSYASGGLHYTVAVPAFTRVGSYGTLTITYANTGASAIPAPLFQVYGDGASFRQIGSGPTDQNFGQYDLILGVSPTGQAGVIQPGQTNTIRVQYYQYDKDTADQAVTLGLFNNPPKETKAHVKTPITVGLPGQTVKWDNLKPDFKPVNDSVELWDQTFANYLKLVGTTSGSLTTALDDAANYLSAHGQRTGDVDQLQYFLLQGAGGWGQLGAAFGIGGFGYGQGDPYNLALTTDGNGNKTVVGAGTARVFTANSGGGFTASAGEYATLAGNVLTEPSGAAIGFTAGGAVDYFQDARGNRTVAMTTPVTVTRTVRTYDTDDDGNPKFDDAGHLVEVEQPVTTTPLLVTALTAPNGDVTRLTYDAAGLCTSLVDPVGRTTTYAYDDDYNLTTITGPAGVTRMAYAPPQAVNYTADPKADPILADLHEVTSITSPSGSVTTHTYDANGRVTSTTADGATTTYSYDAFGNTNGSVRSIDGAIVGVDTAGGGRQTYTGAAGAVTGATGADGSGGGVTTSAAGVTTATAANGAQETITPAPVGGGTATRTDANGHTTLFTVDASGNIVAQADPSGAASNFTYAADGHLATSTSAAGRGVTNAYDAHGLLASQTYSDGTTTTYTYDAHRNLASATTAAGAETFTYDDADRLTGVTYPNGTSLRYAYDAAGRLLSKTDQTNHVTAYTYTAANQLASVTDGSGTALAAYTYDAANNLTRTDYGNGTYTTYAYDTSGAVVTMIGNYAADGTVRSSFAYAHDANGRVSSVTDAAGGVTTYAYDVVGQLTAVTLPGGRTVVYGYDAEGNRTTVTDSAAAPPAVYTTNALNQYTTAGSSSYAYDADGNLTRMTTTAGTTTYAYDAAGRLTAIAGPTGTTTYTYDAFGNRLTSTAGGVTTDDLVDPLSGNVLAGQYTTGGSVVAQYSYGLGLTARTDAAAATGYYAFDAAGNTAALTGADGSTLDAYTYLPYGQTLTSTGTTANPFTFDGQAGVTAAGAGQYLAGARLYDSTTGRFTKRDPLGLAGGSSNLYQYAANDPVNHSDPTGLFPLATVTDGLLFLAKNGYLPLSAADNLSAGLLGNIVRSGAGSAAATETAAGVATTTTAGEAVVGEGILSAFGTAFGAALPTGYSAGAASVAAAQPVTTVLAGATAATAGTATTAASAATPIVFGAADTGIYFTPITTQTLTRIALTSAAGEGTAGTAGVGAATAGGGASSAAFAVAPVALLYYVYRYNAENPNGTPVPTQEVINTATYNRILHNPLVASIFKNFKDTRGRDPDPDDIPDIIKEANEIEHGDPTESRAAGDPNDIVGPAGAGAAGFLPAAVVTLPYQIEFENMPTASAPAAVVTVTQQLDANLDWSTFELGDLTYGGTIVPVPAGRQAFSTTMPLTDALTLRIDATFNAATGQATWTYTTVDNTTGDVPADPTLGFLPPDLTPPQGVGTVAYTVRPKAGLATGATISAQASIVFDNNPAIATPTHLNTIDAAAPTSAIAALPATQARLAIPLSWTGADDAGGSGVATYAVYVSVDNGDFAVAQTTAATSATYAGQPGHSYCFSVVATDAAGNEQDRATVNVAATAVPAIARTLVVTRGKPGRFVDAAGRPVTFALSGPGSATLSFLSDGNADPVSVALTGTTAATHVNVRAAGPKGRLSLGDVSADADLGAFAAPSADLVGSFSVAGTLGSLSLYDAMDGPATIAVGGAGVATAFRFGTLHDVSLTTAGPVRSITATGWTNGSADVDAITAASIGTVNVRGDFDADITAASVKTMNVRGNLTGSTVTLTGASGTDLGRLSVTGAVTASALSAAAGIGSVTVGGMTGSTLYSGVTAGTTGLPTTADALAAGGVIKSFTDRGTSPFADSDVAAYVLGTVRLRNATTANGGATFGTAAHSYRLVTLAQPKAKPVSLRGSKLTATTTPADGDLRVAVV